MDEFILCENRLMTASQPANTRILAGECYCRAVRYEVADAFAYALNCHCSNCRRTTGAAFKPFAGIAHDSLRIVRGVDQRIIYGDDITQDAHCGRCGSLLYSRVREGKWVHVAMGTLIDAPSIRPSAHIFVGSKAPWHEIRTICRSIGGISGMARGTRSARPCQRTAIALARLTKRDPWRRERRHLRDLHHKPARRILLRPSRRL
jgi:hypothetical protein